jgi:hypothetical protein
MMMLKVLGVHHCNEMEYDAHVRMVTWSLMTSSLLLLMTMCVGGVLMVTVIGLIHCLIDVDEMPIDLIDD